MHDFQVLRNLDLSRNKIPALPASIGNFTMLKTLRLGNNRLTKLPDQISALVKLEILQVQVRVTRKMYFAGSTNMFIIF